MHGVYETGLATRQADLILALGARFSDRVAGDRARFRERAKILHVDIDQREIHKNVKADCWLCGDVKTVLRQWMRHIQPQKHTAWLGQIQQWKKEAPKKAVSRQGLPTPQYILQALCRQKDDEDRIVTDVGQHQMWTAQECSFNRPRTFLTSGGLGTMGFGMGAAIGAQAALPHKRVTLITGDGSFHMNLNELVTLKSYKLPGSGCDYEQLCFRDGAAMAEAVLRRTIFTDRPAPVHRFCSACKGVWNRGDDG